MHRITNHWPRHCTGDKKRYKITQLPMHQDYKFSLIFTVFEALNNNLRLKRHKNTLICTLCVAVYSIAPVPLLFKSGAICTPPPTSNGGAAHSRASCALVETSASRRAVRQARVRHSTSRLFPVSKCMGKIASASCLTWRNNYAESRNG